MRLDKLPKGCKLVRLPRKAAPKHKRPRLSAEPRMTPLIGAVSEGGDNWEPMRVCKRPVHDPGGAIVGLT